MENCSFTFKFLRVRNANENGLVRSPTKLFSASPSFWLKNYKLAANSAPSLIARFASSSAANFAPPIL
jgi:hypothetical protein